MHKESQMLEDGACQQFQQCYQYIAEVKLLMTSLQKVTLCVYQVEKQVYKNAIHQKPGINESMFKWMHTEAEKKQIQHKGGLI